MSGCRRCPGHLTHRRTETAERRRSAPLPSRKAQFLSQLSAGLLSAGQLSAGLLSAGQLSAGLLSASLLSASLSSAFRIPRTVFRPILLLACLARDLLWLPAPPHQPLADQFVVCSTILSAGY